MAGKSRHPADEEDLAKEAEAKILLKATKNEPQKK